jgi:hypothetical protein
MQFRERGVERIVVVIVQPRAAGEAVRQFEISPMDLFDWGLATGEAARRTRAALAPQIPGPWCRKTFCPARSFCAPLRLHAEAAATDGFSPVPIVAADVPGMTSETLGDQLRKAEPLRAYLSALDEQAKAECAAGRPPQGFKMVHGRGMRAWRAEYTEAAVAAAISKISNKVDPYDRSLISPAQAEKALGKKVFANLSEFVGTKRGLKMVDESHPDPAVTPTDAQDLTGFVPIPTE